MNWTLVAAVSLLIGAGEGKHPEDLPTEVITVYGHERETIDRFLSTLPSTTARR